MFTIRNKIEFEMAHQLFSCFSECYRDTIHGHSYTLEIFIKSKELNNHGMVKDFGELSKVKDFINRVYDHSLLIPNTFPDEYINLLKLYNKKLIVTSYNPTAENMVKCIFNQIKDNIEGLYKIRLHETTTGYAEYEYL